MRAQMTPGKTANLLRLLDSVRHLDGAIAELGVYQGATLKAMADAVPGKTCYGFDTFSGQPAQSWSEVDFHKPGEFADTELATVRAAVPRNCVLLAGWFPDSAVCVDDKFC